MFEGMNGVGTQLVGWCEMVLGQEVLDRSQLLCGS